MDFSKYKSSFCIDWLEVEITLEENSNQQTIRRKVIEASGRFHLNIDDEEAETCSADRDPAVGEPGTRFLRSELSQHFAKPAVSSANQVRRAAFRGRGRDALRWQALLAAGRK